MTPPPFAEAGNDQLALPGQPVEPQPEGQVTGMDDVLFGQTDRPEEPITSGVPFGPGTNFVRRGSESDKDFMARAAGQIAASPSADSRTKSFLARIMLGT